jgi:hypothetical protein
VACLRCRMSHFSRCSRREKETVRTLPPMLAGPRVRIHLPPRKQSNLSGNNSYITSTRRG